MKFLQILMSMLFVLISVAATPAVAQDGSGTVAFSDDGVASITISMTAKDTEWSAINLVVSKGVKTRSNSIIKIANLQYEVAYNEGTKTYYLKSQGNVLLQSTTVAAIRSHIASDSYEKITGRSAPNS